MAGKLGTFAAGTTQRTVNRPISQSPATSPNPPKPKKPTTLNEEQTRNILRVAGFKGAGLDTAYAITRAESGGRPRALRNTPKSGDLSYGLFQINMMGTMGKNRAKQYGLKSYEDLYDPLTNAKAAYRISKGGTNFKPWSTYTSGKYKQYTKSGGDSSTLSLSSTQDTFTPIVPSGKQAVQSMFKNASNSVAQPTQATQATQSSSLPLGSVNPITNRLRRVF